MNNHKYSFLSNNSKVILFLMIWMTIMPGFSTIAVTYLALEHEILIRSFSTLEWSYFFVLSTITMGLAMTPTTFVSLLSGYFLGMNAILPVILSYQMASLVGYGLAHSLDEHTLDWIINKYPKSKRIFKNVENKQWQTTGLARVSPALPFGLMNVVLSVAGVRLKHFFIGGLIGMLPRTVFFIWLGSQAPLLIEALQTKDQLIWLLLISIVGIFGLFKILKPKT